MWKVFLPGLVAASLLPNKAAHAEMQCGFGCFLKKNEKSINAAISYSAERAREIPLPPTQLYGWGVYAVMNADEIYDRSLKNGVSLWASTQAQMVKQVIPYAVDHIAPPWGRGVLDQLQKQAVTAVRDYAWSELFEAGYSEYAEQIKDEETPQSDHPSHTNSQWRIVAGVTRQDGTEEPMEGLPPECSEMGATDAYQMVAAAGNPAPPEGANCFSSSPLNNTRDYVSVSQQCVFQMWGNTQVISSTRAVDEKTIHQGTTYILPGGQQIESFMMMERCD